MYSAGQSSLGDLSLSGGTCVLVHLGDGVLRLREPHDGDGVDAGPLPEEALPLGKIVTSNVLPCESADVAEDARQWLQAHVDDYARTAGAVAGADDAQMRKLVVPK